MSRYSLFVVSLAILYAVGCTQATIYDDADIQWSPDFDNAVNRCAAIGEPAGTTDRADCVKHMRRDLADEKRYKKSYCYTVLDRVVCKKDPLYPYDAASALEADESDFTSRR